MLSPKHMEDFFFRKGLNTHLVRTLFLFFLVLQVPRSTQNFFFLYHVVRTYMTLQARFPTRYTHAWLTKQRKWHLL